MDNNTDPLTEEIHEHLRETKAVILQGPPGTGKTYHAKQVVEAVAEEGEGDDYRWKQEDNHLPKDKTDENWYPDGQGDEKSGPDVIWELVQFHSNYTYEDFIRGVIVDTEGGGETSFVNRDGILIELARVAQEVSDDTKVVLILDEINRGNVGSVLGESILAIEGDKRGDEWPVRVKYPPGEGWENAEDEDGRAISLPENLWIIGTMNTADESVALIDHAIRRRFRFVDVFPSDEMLHNFYQGQIEPRTQRFITGLFSDIYSSTELPSDYNIGHSYFMSEINDNSERQLVESVVKNVSHDVSNIIKKYHRDGHNLDSPISLHNCYKLDFTSGDTMSRYQEVMNMYDEISRGPYYCHISYKEDIENDDHSDSPPENHAVRSPARWFEYGFVAGGHGSDSFDNVADLGRKADLIIARGRSNKEKYSGVIGIGEVVSHRGIVGDRDLDTVRSVFSVCRMNEYITDKSNYQNQKSQNDVLVRVDWQFYIPAFKWYISERESNKNLEGDLYSDLYQSDKDIEFAGSLKKLIEYQCLKFTSTPDPNYLPGEFEVKKFREKDTIEGEQFHSSPTAQKLKMNFRKVAIYICLTYFQKEFKFDVMSLSDKYLSETDGKIREVNRQFEGLGEDFGGRKSELSVIEPQNDSETPYRTRVWIPVFSDPFAVRDDEFLFDGEQIHVISRIKNNNIHELPDEDPDHLRRKCKISIHHYQEYSGDSMREELDEWKYINSEPVEKFLKQRVVSELNNANNDKTRLKILYRATLFYHRNKSFISDSGLSGNGNSDISEDSLIRQFNEAYQDGSPTDKQQVYKIIGEKIASELNEPVDSTWNYNNLPKREQIRPKDTSPAAPLPEHDQPDCDESELFTGDEIKNCDVFDSIDNIDRLIFGPKKGNDCDWNIINTDKLDINLNEKNENERFFNLKQALCREVDHYRKDGMPEWYQELEG